jgi:hypothetical protein
VRGIGTDALDSQELVELLEPEGVDLGHVADPIAAERALPAPPLRISGEEAAERFWAARREAAPGSIGRRKS